MVIDQAEIEALKKSQPANAAAPPAAPAPLTEDDLAAERRLRRLRVPLIAQLASRKLPMARIRRISVGTILEFERSIDDPLDLLVNNRPIGRGLAVKVGEHFGLRIQEIRDRATRIRSIDPEFSGD